MRSVRANGPGDPGITTDYLLDPNADITRVLAQYTGENQTDYLYGMGMIGQYETHTGPNNTTSNRWSYFGLDGLGSVRQLMDGTSGAQTLVNYDPFGNPLDGMGLPRTSFGFTGEQTDPTGLIYLRARY